MTNRFVKDLLIVEIEATGSDVDKDAIIQLSGLLLDKDNLLEKGVFNTYVRTSLLEGTLAKHAEFLDVPFETIKKSPKAMDAAKQFAEFIHPNATPAFQNVRNLVFLKNLYKKVNYPLPLNLQIFQLWTLEYVLSIKLGLNKLPTLQTLLDYFGLPVKNPHNSLERARLEAEVLRRIVKTL
jgi:DNA polymerase III epsilon subunit-like protein